MMQEPVSIKSARAVLEGRLPVLGAELSIPISSIDENWAHLFFAPENDIETYSHPEERHLLYSFRDKTDRLTSEEENALCTSSLDEMGLRIAHRVYGFAAEEALTLLLECATKNHYRNSRLQARVCAAIRAELSALAADWEQAVSGASEIAHD